MSDFRRRIEAEAKAARDRLHAKTVPPVRGTVEAVETVQHSATVWVGTKKVTASYEGRVPEVGEEVVLAKDGSTWLVISITDKPVAFGGPGSPLTPPAAGFNTAYINEFWLWGHSYVGGAIDRQGGYGTLHPPNIEDYLFGALGLSFPAARNQAVFGVELYSFVGTGLMNSGYAGTGRVVGVVYPYNPGVGPYLAAGPCHAFIIGANDLGRMGDPSMENSRALTLWGHSIRSASAWLRLGAAFDPAMLYNAGAGTDTAVVSSHAGVVYAGGGWTFSSPVDLFGRRHYPFDQLVSTATSNASFQIKVPVDHPGTNVWLFFVGEIGTTGAPAATITYPGGSATLKTNDIVRNPGVAAYPAIPSYATVAVKVPLTTTGVVQTITVNAGTLGSGKRLAFTGWGIEAVDPKLIAWGTIPVAKYWIGAGWDTDQINPTGNPALMHWPSFPDPNDVQGGAFTGVRSGPQDGDAWAGLYDGTTRTVAASFAPTGSVIVADVSTTFNGVANPELFRDYVHPNEYGNQALALSMVAGMNLVALTPKNLTSAADFALSPELFGPPGIWAHA